MKKTAILFPGQGSQYVGMGREFIEQDPKAAELMALAEQSAGLPLQRLSFNGPMEELTRVLHLQPALTAVNLICWRELGKRLPQSWTPAFLAGHSLGEYSALCAASVLSITDTLALVTKRGELMEREGAANPGGMRAVLGLELAAVETLLADFSGPGQVVIANHNTPAQIVLSGDEPGLEALAALCAAQGGKVVKLAVSVANHSPLVAGAVADFAAFMGDIPFHAPRTPVIFNVSGAAETNPDAIRTMMARQIASRVRWLETIEQMLTAGVELFVELGPKNVLSSMIKKIAPKGSAIRFIQADTPNSMDAAAVAILE